MKLHKLCILTVVVSMYNLLKESDLQYLKIISSQQKIQGF